MALTRTNPGLVKRLTSTTGTMRLYYVVDIFALAITPFLLWQFGYKPLQSFLAVLLTVICMYPTARYFGRKESGLPTMAIFCLAYALQFAMPIFTQNATILLSGEETRYLNDSDVTAALLLAIMGVCSILFGYYRFKTSRFREVLPTAGLHLNKAKGILFCIVVGLLFPLLFSLRNIIPEEYQLPVSAMLRLLHAQALVAIGVLGWIVYERRASKLYLLALYGLVIVTAVRGISTGSLEEAVIPFAVFFLVKWLYTRRVSIAMIVVASALILFLSPVKGEYRERMWYGEQEEIAQMSSTAKALLWLKQSTDYWSDTLSGNRTFVEATSSATSRADFIHQVAHIHSMTPSVVPYQYGQTYSYFAVALIPRAVWPNKPTAGTANGFYAVNYGITTEEGAKITTFGVSLLGETFINFGWPGVVLIMLLQGFLISLLERIFGSPESGAGGQAIFIAFFVFFLNGIGSSAEMLFGNILQNLLCGYFLLLWARQKGARTRGLLFRHRAAEFPLSDRYAN